MAKRAKKVIDELTVDSINDREFFDQYISTRTPLKFKNVDCSNLKIFDYNLLTIDKLVDTLGYDEKLLIEQKLNNGFGNGNQRVKMTLSELLEQFKQGNDKYYLTTQYLEHDNEDADEDDENEDEDEEEDDEEEEDDDQQDEQESGDGYELDEELQTEIPAPISIPEQVQSDESDFDFDNLQDDYQDSDDESDMQFRLRELYQPPLIGIKEKLPLKLPYFHPLVPQQINLWLGYSNSENIKTIDEITGESTVTADMLGKYIARGTSSGLHHDHSDNLYILMSGRKRFTLFSPFDAYKLYTIGNILNIYDNGVINYNTNEYAPDWNFINEDGSINDDKLVSEDKQKLFKEMNSKLNLDPPNFSKIPPLLLHLDELPDAHKTKLANFTNKYFEDMVNLTKYQIWLEPGDMLYLPAGWFHEVSSFNDKDNYHMAVNYWFAPPDAKSYDKPYKNNNWAKHIETIHNIVDPTS